MWPPGSGVSVDGCREPEGERRPQRTTAARGEPRVPTLVRVLTVIERGTIELIDGIESLGDAMPGRVAHGRDRVKALRCRPSGDRSPSTPGCAAMAVRPSLRPRAAPSTKCRDGSRATDGAVPVADRTSSSKWWTNQYRVLLAALAYTLLETMRRTALRGTHLARAQCQTLRLRLLKIGAVVTRNTRTVAVRLSSACPDQAVFRLLVHRLTAG